MSNKTKQKSTKEVMTMPMINKDAAGIDIGSKEHWVSVPLDRDENPTRKFGAFTEDLHRLAEWLTQCRITTVAMESTGNYWLNLYLLLEDYGFEVCLANAHHIKNVSGRKTDVKDAEWIQKLHSCGLLSNSFQPDNYTRKLRTYCRTRSALIVQTARDVNHMQKALELMNIKLATVIRDITGKTGLSIVKAILDGERSPEQLSKLRDRRIKADQETIRKSLEGYWREEHLFTLQQAYDSYWFTKRQIKECDTKIENVLAENTSPLETNQDKSKKKRKNKNEPEFDLHSYLKAHFGVDITAVEGIDVLTGMKILSEMGSDFSKWPTLKQFHSWLNVVPNNKITGGKIQSSKVMKKKNPAGEVFRKAAGTLWKDKGPLGDYYRAQRARNGGKGACIAAGKKLATIVYTMVTTQQEYDQNEQVRMKRKHQQKQLEKMKKKVRQLEYELSEAA